MMSITFVFLLSLSLAYSSYSSPSGLTLELITPHSPKSPLFIPNNLTFEERMQMLVQQSHARVQHLSNMLSSTLHTNGSEYSLQQDTTPVPIIKRIMYSAMLVEVGIGTFNSNNAYKSYLLVMDTGSPRIWTQCEDCHLKRDGHCFPQKEDYFPNSKSKSYIPSQTPYVAEYGGGSKSSGFYAMETFTFPSTSSSSSSPPLKLPKIIFGCGINNHFSGANDRTNLLAGVFGMGMNPPSFIKQIETQSGGRFSYCFLHEQVQNPPPMYLRFGTDIKPPPTFQTISFIEPFSYYVVKLVDLGIKGERFNIDPNMINPPSIRVKGLIVDSGSPISYLSKGAYDVVESKLEKYFSDKKEEFKKVENARKRLCYSRIKGAQGYNNIPGITFYFEGGVKLDVIPEGTFVRIVDPGKNIEYFCLQIAPTPINVNLLGAFQQVNFKFIYNIKEKTLQYGREDCATKG